MKMFDLKSAHEAALVVSLFALLFPMSSNAAQSDIKLGLPIDCTVGKDCWLVNLVDLDASAGVKDYNCQDESYNGHKGTDISVRDLKALRKGVKVLAAAAGVVRNIRNGMSDDTGEEFKSKKIKGRECGNGVAIKHDNGWQTQYCHFRKGSVSVKPGQRVDKGQKLGLVGFSGKTVFPHIHMTVRYQGKVVDPFTGRNRGKSCGLGADYLWDAALIPDLTKPLMAIFSAGFSGIKPKASAVLAGLHQDKVISRQAPFLVIWGLTYRIKKGDRVHTQITSPDGGVVISHDSVIKQNKARRLLYAGKKRKKLYWPEGIYRGEMSIRRPLADGSEHVVRVKREMLVR